MNEEKALGAVIRERRLSVGLTQELLAERAGLSPRGIRMLEAGHSRPLVDTVRRVAEALDVDPDERERWLARAGPVPRSRTLGEKSSTIGRATPLPPSTTTLVGRGRDVSEVTALLLQVGRPIVTLVGPGGVGKTSLALQVARNCHDRYADGTAFVDLSPVSDPALVLATIAQSLGLILDARRPVSDLLRSNLLTRQLLLVLDNFEQVSEAGPALAALVLDCPGVRAMVTSRSALGLRSEQVYPVSPLEQPDPRNLARLEVLARIPSVELFVQQARAVEPGFVLTPANAAPIAAICALLDGLPLAIELAAACISFLPPPELLTRLTQPLVLLAAGPRDAPARQQSMRATIAWSYDLVPAAARSLFRALAAFPGGSTLDAAQAIWNASEPDTLLALRQLVAAHLVQMLPAAEPRYRLPVTIREYGLERLEAEAELGELRARHAEYFCRLADESEPVSYTDEQIACWDRLDAEIDNVRGALDWCVECGRRGDPEAVERGLRAAGNLLPFWFNRPRLSEGIEWLDRLLRLPLAERPTPGRARALVGMAYLAGATLANIGWQDMLEESTSIFRDAGDEMGLAYALGVRALFEVMLTGDADSARTAAADARALYAHLGETGMADPGIQGKLASVRVVEGLASLRLGEPARARQELAMALEEGTRSGGSWQAMTALDPLAGLAWGGGDLAAARRFFERAIELSEGAGDEHTRASSLWLLGELSSEAGDVAAARSYLERALAIVQAVGDVECLARSFWAVGVLAHGAEAPERARELAQATLAPASPQAGRLTLHQAVAGALQRLPG